MNTATKVSSNVPWVEYAKAIGIILVVYGHVARGIVNSGIEIPFDYHYLIDDIIYSFHMPLFFFISGIFFYDSFIKKGAKLFVYSKVDTILYPYIFWSLFQGLLEVFLSSYTNGDVGLVKVFSLLWEPRAQFWFLYALFFNFVFLTVLYLYFSGRFFYCFLLSVFLFFISKIFSWSSVFGYVGNNLIYIVFGIGFSKFRVSYFACRKIVFYLSFVVFVVFVVFQVFSQFYLRDDLFLDFFVALFSIFFVVSFSFRLADFSIPFLRFVGASSLCIYLLHIISGSGVRVILSKIFGVDLYFVHIFFGVVFAIIIPLFFLLLIRLIDIRYVFSCPISKLLKKIY
jgi:fucose 4-O-acetylase-like acetyltransferase